MYLVKNELFATRDSVGKATEEMMHAVETLPSEYRQMIMATFMIFWNTVAQGLIEEKEE